MTSNEASANGTAQFLAFDESQQVGIDGIGLGGWHAVGKPL